ncbi:hypothetical protein [Tepidibacter sp. Z1-5]|uniref:hypothetical protein n=1 Tax=Tepidibacter sp. Z1-5 TaxID=3134138 RepID=UPI0030C3B8ED
MLYKRLETHRKEMNSFSIDYLLPKDYLVKKIENAINFDSIYNLVESCYSADRGISSSDPVILIKIALIQCMFGITSKIPRHTTFSKNYI